MRAPGPLTAKRCKLYIANGNEYADKVTAADVSGLKAAMKAAYDAVHEKKSDGTWRFPNAYLGMDPTHYQEKSGIVARTLMEITEFCDFNAWSTYPPGRESTSSDPTFTKPVKDANANGGHIERCLQRTKAVQDKARQVTGDPNRVVEFQTWEVGLGTTRTTRTTAPTTPPTALRSGPRQGSRTRAHQHDDVVVEPRSVRLRAVTKRAQ